MASTGLGDIPGARFHSPNINQNASVASGGANARIGQFGPLAHNVRLRNVWYTPTGADLSATQSATYRRLTIYNGGASGTATASTARMASVNLSASQASLGPVGFTVDTTVTMASGQIAYFSQETVGGTDANGTVLPAGYFSVAYEVI